MDAELAWREFCRLPAQVSLLGALPLGLGPSEAGTEAMWPAPQFERWAPRPKSPTAGSLLWAL